MSDALAVVIAQRGYHCDVQPMSDGGEGFIDAFAGSVETFPVRGPLGPLVEARVVVASRGGKRFGVVEVADAIGRDLLPRPSSDQAVVASSEGVGELILAVARLGVDEVLVGCGGSATSDGGLGCYRVLRDAGGLPVPVTAATDVAATFSGAIDFAEQKGVSTSDLPVIRQRLDDVRALYLEEQGVDVEQIERSGAAGGISGAIAALGGRLASGFSIVAEAADLVNLTKNVSLVITGEGRFDAGSLQGKVVVGLADLVDGDTELLVICGAVEEDAATSFMKDHPKASMRSLESAFGRERSFAHVRDCLKESVADFLDGWTP